ncbi:unnamed protein product, partial [Prorocentrum cordatum]
MAPQRIAQLPEDLRCRGQAASTDWARSRLRAKPALEHAPKSAALGGRHETGRPQARSEAAAPACPVAQRKRNDGLAQRIFRQLYEAPAGVPHRHPPDTISPVHAVLEVHLAVLGALKPSMEDRLPKALASWMNKVEGPQRYNVLAAAGLLRCRLVDAAGMDRILAGWIGRESGACASELPARACAEAAMNAQAVDFAVMLLQRVCILQQSAAGSEFPETLEVLAEQVRLVLQQQAAAEQQAKTLADGKAAAAALGLKPPAAPQEPPRPPPQDLHLAEAAGQLLERLRAEAPPSAPCQALGERVAARLEEEQRKRTAGHQDAAEAISREAIVAVFDEWHKVFDASPDAGVQGQGGQAGCMQQVLQR